MSDTSILGFSCDSIVILMDTLNETTGVTKFKIYNNIHIENKINFPVFSYKYELYPPGVFPSKEGRVVFAVSGPFNKWSIFNYYKEKAQIDKDNYVKLIHPHSYIAESSVIETGGFIEPAVVISSQSQIGFGVNIKRGALIGHHNKIGDFVDLNPGVTVSGNVKIGRGSIIGSGAIISDNIAIGNNCMIGAGSVVMKDIPSGVVAYGNPCKVIRENDKWEI